MAASKTSLDLLSQAAELVNTSMAPSINAIKNTSTKDLPTRGKKLIRTRSRRNLPITNAGDNKTEKKNGISPQLSPKKDPSLLSFAYIFPKAPIEGDANYVSQMSSSYPPPPPYTSPSESLLLKNNPVSSYPRESFFKSPPSPPVFVMETSSNENEDDDERPLDMSKKCSGNDTRQQARPSVITCASALYSSKCRHVDQSTCLCSPSRNSPTRKLDMDADNSSDGVVEHRTGHRRQISSGMCDPVIDEHFRRSLGKDYSEIFASTTSNSVSVTVDDHFAKALGDTWLRLQQPDNKDSPLSKTSTNLKRTPSLVTL